MNAQTDIIEKKLAEPVMESYRGIPKSVGEIKIESKPILLSSEDIENFFSLLRNNLTVASPLKNLVRKEFIRYLQGIQKNVHPVTTTLLRYLNDLLKQVTIADEKSDQISNLIAAIKSNSKFINFSLTEILDDEDKKGEIKINTPTAVNFLPINITTGSIFPPPKRQKLAEISQESSLEEQLIVIRGKIESLTQEDNFLKRKVGLFEAAQELQSISDKRFNNSSEDAAKILATVKCLNDFFQKSLTTYVQGLYKTSIPLNDNDDGNNELKNFIWKTQGIIDLLKHLFPQEYPAILQLSKICNLSVIYNLYDQLAVSGTNLFTSVCLCKEAIGAACELVIIANQLNGNIEAVQYRIKAEVFIREAVEALGVGIAKISFNLKQAKVKKKEKLDSLLNHALRCFKIRSAIAILCLNPILSPLLDINIPEIDKQLVEVFKNCKHNLLILLNSSNENQKQIIQTFFESLHQFVKNESIIISERHQFAEIGFVFAFSLKKINSIYAFDALELCINADFLDFCEDSVKEELLDSLLACYHQLAEAFSKNKDFLSAEKTLSTFYVKLEYVKVNKLCSSKKIEELQALYIEYCNDVKLAKLKNWDSFNLRIDGDQWTDADSDSFGDSEMDEDVMKLDFSDRFFQPPNTQDQSSTKNNSPQRNPK